MKTLKGLLTVIGCIILTTTASAQVDIRGYYWLVTPEGDAEVGRDGVAGTKIDLENDFGYSDEEAVIGAAVVLGNTLQAEISGFTFSTDADNTITRDIRFRDQDYTVSEQIHSEVELTVVRGTVRLQFGPDTFQGGIAAGGYYLDIRAAAEAAARQVSSDVDGKYGVPVLGAFINAEPLPWLGGRVSLYGGKWSVDPLDVEYIDLEAFGYLKIDPGFYAGIGYRHLQIAAADTDEPLDIDLSFSGPMATIGFEW